MMVMLLGEFRAIVMFCSLEDVGTASPHCSLSASSSTIITFVPNAVGGLLALLVQGGMQQQPMLCFIIGLMMLVMRRSNVEVSAVLLKVCFHQLKFF
jgi:hypothetical protein